MPSLVWPLACPELLGDEPQPGRLLQGGPPLHQPELQDHDVHYSHKGVQLDLLALDPTAV